MEWYDHGMSDVTRILKSIEQGDEQAAEELLPLVYDELRKLAATRMSMENPGQTLQPTALVHEAYLRLVDGDNPQQWESRGHFFSAAAEAMRRILVESARRKGRVKHGGGFEKVSAETIGDIAADEAHDLLEVSEVLDLLEQSDPVAAGFVKLRYFVGMTVEQASEAMGISVRSGYYTWDYARSWLSVRLKEDA